MQTKRTDDTDNGGMTHTVSDELTEIFNSNPIASLYYRKLEAQALYSLTHPRDLANVELLLVQPRSPSEHRGPDPEKMLVSCMH